MRFLLLGCALAFVTAGRADDKAAKKELEKLQGTWKLIEVEVRGNKTDVAGKVPDSFDLVISGDKMKVGKHEIALVLDTTTDPKLIDLHYTKDKVVVESIYRLDGDKLTMCWKRGVGPAKDRPTAFKTDDKTEYEVRVYKLDKPKK